MATVYGEFVEAIYRQLSDPDQEDPSFSEDVVYDAVVAAHDAILPWVPNFNEVELTTGSDPDLFELPDDVYELQAVQLVDDNKKFIPQATLAAGTARGNTLAENDWTESPRGYLSLANDLTEGDTIKVYYLARWPVPTSSSDTSFELVVPRHAWQGIIYYALSVILSPKIMDTATLGTFKSKVDSGNPEHNPLKDNANWFRSLFLQEMKMMPPYQKVAA